MKLLYRLLLLLLLVFGIVNSGFILAETREITYKWIKDNSISESQVLKKIRTMTAEEIKNYLSSSEDKLNRKLTKFVLSYLLQKYPEQMDTNPELIHFKARLFCRINESEKARDSFFQYNELIYKNQKDHLCPYYRRTKTYDVIEDLGKYGNRICLKQAVDMITLFKERYNNITDNEEYYFKLLNEHYQEVDYIERGVRSFEEYLKNLKRIISSGNKNELKKLILEHYLDKATGEKLYTRLVDDYIKKGLRCWKIEIIDLYIPSPDIYKRSWMFEYYIYVVPQGNAKIQNVQQEKRKLYYDTFRIIDGKIRFVKED